MLTACRKQIGEEKKKMPLTTKNWHSVWPGLLCSKWHRFASFSQRYLQVWFPCQSLFQFSLVVMFWNAHARLQLPDQHIPSLFLRMWHYLGSYRFTGIIFFMPGGIFLCILTHQSRFVSCFFSLLFSWLRSIPCPFFLNEKLPLTTHWNGATCQGGCSSTLCSIFFFFANAA